MKDLFSRIADKSEEIDFSISVSYLEIYNENIRDLLAPENGALPLRESNGVATPAGLSTKEPTSAVDVVEWITLGNTNRTVNATEANSTSSRSHAVLRVTITQKPKSGGMKDEETTASLSVIDLAGSERASVTKNKGERLNEGANINRSLLALGNCINALCDPRKRGHVPYRDSKLTRLLKQSLGGNCKTVMIVCVSPSSAHYDETHNTLQYANRAKEIKTKAIRNFVSVDRHVGQYCAQIQEQTITIERLKSQLAAQKLVSSAGNRDEDTRAVKAIVTKLETTWEASKLRLVAGEKATMERNHLESMLQLIRQWTSTAFASIDQSDSSTFTDIASTIINTLRTSSDELIRSFCHASSTLREEINRSESSNDTYSTLSSNLSHTLSSERPSAISLLSLETFDLKMSTALAEARFSGLSEGLKVQAKMMEMMCIARGSVATAISSLSDADQSSLHQLQQLGEGIDKANREVFAALLNHSTSSSNALSSSSLGFSGVKRTVGTRSPMEPASVWADTIPRKVARGAFSGFGSTASSSVYASPQRQRQRPRKGVSYVRSSPKKKKGVQWRDEGEDGGKLAELRTFEEVGPSPPVRTFSPVASTSNLNPFPQLPPTPRLSSWTAASNLNNIGGSTSAAADMSALVARQRASATKSLRNKASTSRLNTSSLGSLAEETSKPFSFDMPTPPMPTSTFGRTPFSDIGNSSFTSDTSSTSTPTGFFPLKSSVAPSSIFKRSTTESSASGTPRRTASKVRRVSTLGPQRSLKSTSRRGSYIAPPTPAFSSKSRGLSSSTGFGSNLLPGSIRKSPRKVMASTTASMRRPSLAIKGGPSFSAPTTSSSALGLGLGLAGVGGGSNLSSMRRESSLMGSGFLAGGGRRSGSGGRETLPVAAKGSWR